MYLSKKTILISIILVILILGDKNLLLIMNLLSLAVYLAPGKINKSEGKLFLFLLIPTLTALAAGILYYPIYDILKDLYYLLNPVLFLILGLQIAKKVELKILLKAIVIIGTLFSVYHIFIVFSSFGIIAFQDFRQVRDAEGGGHIITIIAMVICISSIYFYKREIFSSIKITIVAIVLNGLSFLFAGSRTFWLIFLVLMLCTTYDLYKDRIWLLITSSLLIVFFLVVFLSRNQENEFAKSILNSSTELSVGDYSNLSEMNAKYRGWESYRAFFTFVEGKPFQIIIGHGAGKMIDLGTYFYLAGDYRRYIPVLHNGYMYALVKTGIIGLLCNLIYFIYVLRYASKNNSFIDTKSNFLPLLLIGLIISIFISNIVVAGLYNPALELLGLLCGSVFYYIYSFRNEPVTIENKI